MKLLAQAMLRSPSAFGHLLCALDCYLGSPYEVAIIGLPEAEDTRALFGAVFLRYLPNKVVAFAAPGDERSAQAIKLLEGRSSIEGKAAAYVCRNFTCEAPVTDAARLGEQLSR